MVFTSDPHKNYLLVQINSSVESESSRAQQAFIYVSIPHGFLLKYHNSSFIIRVVQLYIMQISVFFTWMKILVHCFKKNLKAYFSN